MAKITSAPFLLGTESFVAETDGDSSTIVRIAKGKAITQTEKEIAGDYYNAALDEIDYAKIYNLDYGANFLNKLGASDQWMGTALTDPMYKDVFKKATGKNSPNISFASTKDSKLNWETTTQNTDANNRSTSRGGKFIGRYPLNKDRKRFDYLQVTAKKYKPSSFSGVDGMTQDAESRNMSSVGSVYLPMQPGLAESSNVNWGGETLNAIDAAMANIAGSTIKGAGESSAQAGKEAAMSMKDAAKTVFGEGGVGSKEVAAYFAGQAVGKNVFTRTTGKIMNPNLELLFSGPSLRTFNYNYQFTPREHREAKEIRSIIKFFKKNMSPIRK